MKFFAGLLLIPVFAFGQTCAPADMLRPADSVQGTLSDANCRLSDGNFYAEYSLVVPTRGQLEIGSDFDLILRDSEGHKIDAGAAIKRPVERGSYSVVVMGGGGDFNLHSNFTPEPDTLCRSFPNIGLDQSVSGYLGGGSCTLPDKTFYDGYLLHTLSSGTLDIALDSGQIIVRSDDLHLLATDTGKVSVPVRGDQTYAILATAAEPGSYKLSVSFTIADDEPCRLQKILTESTEVAAKVTADCGLTPLGSESQAPFHYYSLKVPGHGAADVQVSSYFFDPLVYLLDASGNLIQADTQSGGQGTAIIQQQLKPGNYTLVLFSVQPDGGDYTLQYNFRPGPPETCPVLELEAGMVATGSLSSASCRTREGISDAYRISMTSAGTLAITMTAESFDTALALRDDKDNRILVNNAPIDEISQAKIVADLPAGNYSVVATTQNAPGSYSISYQLTPHEVPPCRTAQKMDPNSGYIGVLSEKSCRASNGQPIDYYEFTITADGTVATVVTSSQLDSFLTLQDSEGNVLRWDDNSYGLSNAIAVGFLPKGTYRVGVRAANTSEIGDLYRLDVLFTPGERPSGCSSLRDLSPGNVITGKLAYTACQYTDDTFADIYQINLTDATQLEIGLDSTQFDAYLVLLDSKGNVIDEDDNNAGGTDAHLARSLDPGSYYLVVKPFSEYYSVGLYVLGIVRL